MGIGLVLVVGILAFFAGCMLYFLYEFVKLKKFIWAIFGYGKANKLASQMANIGEPTIENKIKLYNKENITNPLIPIMAEKKLERGKRDDRRASKGIFGRFKRGGTPEAVGEASEPELPEQPSSSGIRSPDYADADAPSPRKDAPNPRKDSSYFA